MAAIAETIFHLGSAPQSMQPAKVNITRSLQCTSWQGLGAAGAAAERLSTEPAKVRAEKPILNLDELTRPVAAEKVTRPVAAEKVMFHGLDSDEAALVGEKLIKILEDLQDVAQNGSSPTSVTDPWLPTQADDSTVSPASLPTPPSGVNVDGSGSGSSPSLMADDDVSELASIGSGLHYSGSCRPCKWAWSETGCAHGAKCSFCHFRHEWTDKHKRRPCKGKRTYYRKLLTRIATARGETLVDKSEPQKVELLLEDLPLPAFASVQSAWGTPVPPPPGLGSMSQ